MLRTFNQHQHRHVQSLDGLWEFITAEEQQSSPRRSKPRGQASLPAAYTRTVLAPFVWDTLPGLEQYRGKAYARRRYASPPQGKAARLVFGGVSHTGVVYVDGRKLGRHEDAYTPFALLDTHQSSRPQIKSTDRELVVEIDNSFGDHAALHIPNDYMTYGGLIRPTAVEYVPAIYIDQMHATPVAPPQTSKRNATAAAWRNPWSLQVVVRLHNWSDQASTRRIQLDVAGRTFNLGEKTVKPDSIATITAILEDLAVEPWSAAAPQLYPITATLHDEDDQPVDDLIERVGFRDIRVAGESLLLNGEPLKLRGFNRHEDHPQFGSALPLSAMMADLHLISDLGANCIRTSHYPNDMRFLDLCDELGFYVWEESHARTVSFDHPAYRRQIDASTSEMIDWHFNHPSIVIWGCLNECETRTPAGRREHARVLSMIKKADPSRPHTYAGCHTDQDLCMDLPDIVSWNLYAGWYVGGPDDAGDGIEDMFRYLRSTKGAGRKKKPVIMSEFGAGGIYGHRQPREAHWSEEYQATVLRGQLNAYLNHPKVSGALIWQYCDVRLSREWWGHRPRNMNNKGIVDEYRRPKLAYAAVKAMFEEDAKQ